MAELAKNRLIAIFSSGTLDEAINSFEKINSKIHNCPEISKKYYANIQKLLEAIISEELLKLSSNTWYSVTFLYMFFLTYILFELPLEIGFEMEYNWFLFGIEIISLLVSAAFIFVNFKNYFFWSGTDKVYKESSLCFALDIFSLSSFNIIFASEQIEDPIVLITLLRLLRLVANFRLIALFAKIRNLLRQFSAQLKFLETMICVLALIHFMSCSFFYYSLNERYSSWVKDNDLQDPETGNQYSWALFHVLNILTCTGYGGFMLEANDSERIWTVFLFSSEIWWTLSFLGWWQLRLPLLNLTWSII
ncbi:unnamed protein product [Blepharisma stoltei]|uniref:Ion transport domain-containing protein n=1 Tax=Blepharisma stoltei TaxID=1481888 RepID=A0AAU9JIX9_9CILI|nr:unnamed protein product [Blepharisma stoltei]